jgi:hypothetical protein
MADAAPHARLAARARQRRAEAITQAGALTPGTSLCAIGRSGEGFPAPKYWEGQAAAFGDVLRALRREPSDVEAALASLRERWSETRASAQDRSRDWQAYAAGGWDALDELVEG